MYHNIIVLIITYCIDSYRFPRIVTMVPSFVGPIIIILSSNTLVNSAVAFVKALVVFWVIFVAFSKALVAFANVR